MEVREYLLHCPASRHLQLHPPKLVEAFQVGGEYQPEGRLEYSKPACEKTVNTNQ